jgi:chorismate mutase
MAMKQDGAAANRARALRSLRELVAALDRRVPHVERVGEVKIAREAAALRKEAQRRIADLEKDA